MIKKAISTEARRPVISTIVIGAFIAILASVILAMCISYMGIREIISEKKIKYAVLVGIYLSSLICGSIVSARVTHKKAVMALLAVTIYIMIMICTGMLIFESPFQNLMINCVIALTGGATSIILPLIFSRNSRRVKIRSR